MSTPEELVEARRQKFRSAAAKEREAKLIQWLPIVISALSLIVAVIALFRAG
jgi:hypothetical protein